jgi:hypothetical protein
MYPSLLLYSFEKIVGFVFPRHLRLIGMPLPCYEPYACLVHLEKKILNNSHTLQPITHQFPGDPREWTIDKARL